jgi:hypothetical protein
VRADGPFAPPASFLVLLFMGLLLAPVTLYLYAAHPSWTWMYLVNPEKVASIAILPLVVAHVGAVAFGWYLGARFIMADKMKVASIVAAAGLLLVLIGVLLSWHRLGQYGTYTEYEQGRSLPIMEVKLGYVLVTLVVATFVSASVLAIELLRDSRRVRSR